MGPLARFLRRVFVPWWSPEQDREVKRHSEDIRQRSIAARISAEQTRKAYDAMSKRLER